MRALGLFGRCAAAGLDHSSSTAHRDGKHHSLDKLQRSSLHIKGTTKHEASLALLIAACDALIAPPAPKKPMSPPRRRRALCCLARSPCYRRRHRPRDHEGEHGQSFSGRGKTKGVTFDFDEQLLGGCAIARSRQPWPTRPRRGGCKAHVAAIDAARRTATRAN